MSSPLVCSPESRATFSIFGGTHHGTAQTDWERALRAMIRQKGFLGRTERVYCDWSTKFARFLAPRAVEAAEESDVSAFLTALATEPRSSRSAQKQALNAVVFLLREALKRPLREIEFQRAAPCKKMLPLLTAQEIERLQRQLDGTVRLMAELAYGAGLRLWHLVRLRVRHLDLARLRVHARAPAGKADEQSIVAVPIELKRALESHLARLRQLQELDRAAGLSGVWVEARAAADPRAGESFEWQWLFPSRELAVDPITGVRRRQHVTELAFKRALGQAAIRARITKRVTPELLRRSFGAHVFGRGKPEDGWLKAES